MHYGFNYFFQYSSPLTDFFYGNTNLNFFLQHLPTFSNKNRNNTENKKTFYRNDRRMKSTFNKRRWQTECYFVNRNKSVPTALVSTIKASPHFLSSLTLSFFDNQRVKLKKPIPMASVLSDVSGDRLYIISIMMMIIYSCIFIICSFEKRSQTAPYN